jgi:peptidylprolyl isomerase
MKGIILIIIAVLVAVSFITMRDTTQDEQPQIFPDGLKVEDLIAGTGEEAVKGALITAHYLGTLEDGTKFDSSYDRGQPFQFLLGAGQVIQGWDLGVLGMKVGGKRKLTIAPDLAYGSTGAGDLIPPDATLFFEIELVSVEKAVDLSK